MDLQAIFSDNQLAILGCFAALAVCGGIAGLSFQFGSAGRKRTTSNQDAYDAIRPLHGGSGPVADSDTRRAA